MNTDVLFGTAWCFVFIIAGSRVCCSDADEGGGSNRALVFFWAIPLDPVPFRRRHQDRPVFWVGRSCWWVIRNGGFRGPLYVCTVAWPSLCMFFFLLAPCCPSLLRPVVVLVFFPCLAFLIVCLLLFVFALVLGTSPCSPPPTLFSWVRWLVFVLYFVSVEPL